MIEKELNKTQTLQSLWGVCLYMLSSCSFFSDTRIGSHAYCVYTRVWKAEAFSLTIFYFDCEKEERVALQLLRK